ncbi:MAG: 2OG-Fe(II) oxygenase family protein [Pseudomonadota bacterium]
MANILIANTLEDFFPKASYAALVDPDRTSVAAAARDFVEAGRRYGCVRLIDAPARLFSEQVLGEALRVFAMTDAGRRRLYKKSFDTSHSNLYRGWYPSPQPNWGTEGYDIGPDIARAMAVMDPDDPITEPTPVPSDEELSDAAGWRAAAAEYYLGMEAVGRVVLRAIAVGLGLDSARFEDVFDDGVSTLRLIRFIPDADGEQRLATPDHTDSGLVTLLVQCDEAGLEFLDPAGRWRAVPPEAATIVVNFGQLLETWTNGAVKATRHRVLDLKQERRSAPFFVEPRVDAVISPLKELGGAEFAPFAFGDYLWARTTEFKEQAGVAHLRAPRGLALGAR